MRIAQLAPLWETVPPKTYGGTELVVYSLTEELIKRGHDVTLFACGESKTSAKLNSCIQKPMREANVTIPTFYEIESTSNLLKIADEFDIIHNHIGFLPLPFGKLIDTPIVTTFHGAFTIKEEANIYQNYYKNENYISISDYQRNGAPDLNYVSTVYNGIDVERYSYNFDINTKDPYLLFLGRISIEKGTHHSIRIAKETGHKLIIAGKIGENDTEYYENEILNHIDGKQIVYIGEVGHAQKCELFKNAFATLHTVTWPEPFGLVMAESMACGTPVLALRDGSIPEVIKHGVTGFVEDNVEALIEHIKDIPNISREACRKHVSDNFTTQLMVDNYLDAYKKVIIQHARKKDFDIEQKLPAQAKKIG